MTRSTKANRTIGTAKIPDAGEDIGDREGRLRPVEKAASYVPNAGKIGRPAADSSPPRNRMTYLQESHLRTLSPTEQQPDWRSNSGSHQQEEKQPQDQTVYH